MAWNQRKTSRFKKLSNTIKENSWPNLNQAQSLLYSFSEEGAKTSKKVLEKHKK